MTKEDDKIQKDGFDKWFSKQLLSCESCLTRDVLRNQRKNLFDEWMQIRPMIDSLSPERDSQTGRVLSEAST